jgi:hypothetical protein
VDETCNCGGQHHEGANYYVSVIDGPRFNLLAGPYKTHVEALAMLRPTQNLANKLVPQSWFYSFGTVAMKPECTRTGKLNEKLAELDRTEKLHAIRINVTGMQGDRNVINPVLLKYLPVSMTQYTEQFEWSYGQVLEVIETLQHGRKSKAKDAAIELLQLKIDSIRCG